MKRLVLPLLAVAVAAPLHVAYRAGAASTTGTASTLQPSHPALPWLFNLQDTVATDEPEHELLELPDLALDCDPPADATFRLVADVAPAPGREVIRGSYREGIVVTGREGEVLATTPGFPCGGTADAFEVLGGGRAFHQPLIVVAATTGGRREQMTWLGLYRVTSDGRLDAVFTGAVELREDGVVRRGSVTVLPGALLVREPTGQVSFWIWDPTSGVYLPPAAYEPIAGHHS